MNGIRWGIALAMAAAILAPCGLADTPGRHPRYLHARSDLRLALRYLENFSAEPNVMGHVRAARREIEAALSEVDRAAYIDRKPLEAPARIDANLDRPGRFRKVLALLRSARADISGEEDSRAANHWRDVAYRHIDRALESVERAMADKRYDRERGY